MKYYIAQLEIQHGEFCHTETILIERETEEEANKAHIHTAATFYDEEDIEERRWSEESFWACGEMIITASRMDEITEEAYNGVKRFMYEA